MSRATARTIAYPLIGQTTGDLETALLPVDQVLPLTGYTAGYGRRIGDLEITAMALAPEGHVYRRVDMRIDVENRWNGPPSTLKDMDTAAILYADRPSQSIEDHLREARMHINGYALNEAVSQDPRIIDAIVAHPRYAGIRCVVWTAMVRGVAVTVITAANDAYIVDVVCAAAPGLHIRIPNTREMTLLMEQKAHAASAVRRPTLRPG